MRVFEYKVLENRVEKEVLFDGKWPPSDEFDHSVSENIKYKVGYDYEIQVLLNSKILYSTSFKAMNNFKYSLTVNDMKIYRQGKSDSAYCTDYIHVDSLRTFCVFMIGREHFEEI